jgi:hypothetical protein
MPFSPIQRLMPLRFSTALVTVALVTTMAHAQSTSPPVVDAQRVVCAYGTHGVRAPSGVEPNAEYVLIVDVRTAVNLEIVRLVSFELVDASGVVVARGSWPFGRRTVPRSRSTNDLSDVGTSPFSGDLPAGSQTRLLLHGSLDHPLDVVMRAHPVTFRARIEDRSGTHVDVNGPVDPPWPSA